MRVLFRVKTPKGQAARTSRIIKTFIIGMPNKKLKTEIYTNDDDSEIFWDCEGDFKRIMNVQSNLARFDYIIKTIFEHKLMKKYGVSKLSKEDEAELKNMLLNHTEVKIIKVSEQEVVVEGLTYWERIKKFFKKVEVKDDFADES